MTHTNISNNLKNVIFFALLICSFAININKNNLKPSLEKLILLEQNSTTYDNKALSNSTNSNNSTNSESKASSNSTVKDNNSSVINQTSERILKQYNPIDGEFQNNKNKSIKILVFLFLSLIVFRIIFYYITPTNAFLKKCFSDLVYNTFSYFLAIAILIVILSLKMTIPTFTWAGIIIISFVFVFLWMLFLTINIFLGYFMCEKWKKLESQAISFKKIKSDYEQSSNDENFEIAEYLIAKIQFIYPFYTTLKSMSLKQDFNFSLYLEKNFIKYFYSVQNLTISSWVFVLIVVFIWNVFISNTSDKTRLVLMCTLPLVNIMLLLALIIYLKSIYRKCVPEIDSNNMFELTDIPSTNPEDYKAHFSQPPIYLKQAYEKNSELLNNPKSYSFTQHIIGRASSLFEDVILFGVSGKYILNNLFQSILSTFIGYLTLISIVEGYYFYNTFGTYIIPVFIIIVLFYFALICYLSTICIRWLTILNCIEMNRDEEAIYEVIEEQNKESVKRKLSLYTEFKKLYFDIKIEQNPDFNSLKRIGFKNMIDLQVKRYKNSKSFRLMSNQIENTHIDINEELREFLSSIGNEMNNQDIEFLLHLIEDLKQDENQKLTVNQIYDIYGAILHFESITPFELMNFVFEKYYYEKYNVQNVRLLVINKSKLIEFFSNFEEYFTEKSVNDAIQESQYLGKEFALESFINSISLPIKNYPK